MKLKYKFDRGRNAASLFHFPMVTLPTNELLDAILMPRPGERVIAAARYGDTLALCTGDFQMVMVPLAWFADRYEMVKPDPDRLELRDWGNTVALGDYEAAADFVIETFQRANKA